MDSSSESKGKKNQIQPKEECEPYSSYDSHFLQPTWVRCTFRPGDEVDRFLLDYGRNFLLPVGILLWCLFLIAS